MSFNDWIFSKFPNPSINGRWGALHICVLLACVALIVTISFVFKNKNEKSKRVVLFVLVGLILFFELTRRSINLIATSDYGIQNILHILLPRPWCAISCWTLILAPIINKKFYYNFASITSFLCALIFFAYPGVGFNNQYILFENLYSIATHSLLLITSLVLITLKFIDFNYKTCYKEFLCYVFTLGYSLIEIFVLKIEDDPMYFMPNNDVMEVLGISYPIYLLIYVAFLLFYFNLFYLFSLKKKKQKNNAY
ncbi:MAG: hypothetical protein ACI4TI_00640 [Christensenellales bacterium]